MQSAALDGLARTDPLGAASRVSRRLQSALARRDLLDGALALNEAGAALRALGDDRLGTFDAMAARDKLEALYTSTYEAAREAVADWFAGKLVAFDLETTEPIPAHGSGRTLADMEISVLCLAGVAVGAGAGAGAGGDPAERLTLWNRGVDGMPLELALDAFDAAVLITGFNVKRFDFMVLRFAYGEDEARFEAHLAKTVDLWDLVRARAGRSFKLAQLIEANPGVPEKLGDGLGAVRLWREGRLAELERYCVRDADAELALARRPAVLLPGGGAAVGPLAALRTGQLGGASTEPLAADGFPRVPPGAPQSLAQGSQEWLAFRAGKIGASSVAALLRLDPLLEREAAFETLIGASDGPAETAAMRLGREREATIAGIVARHLGARMQETGSWPHPEHAFLFASPDRLMIDREGRLGVLECKSTRRLAKPSAKFLLQVQVQMACVPQAGYAYLAQYDGRTCALHRIERDKNLFRGIIGYLQDVYDAALPALQGRVATEEVFSEDVRLYRRPEQLDVRELLSDTEADHVGTTVII